MENVNSILAEIAQIPFEVKCRFEENIDFLRDYRTDKHPLFCIEPSDRDLEMMQNEFDRIAQKYGETKRQLSRSFLENNAMHILLSTEMAKRDVLMLHGSALCMDGEAYIFTAPSGTGKSTHARLWREVFGDRVWMINDDKPMLKIGEDRVTVFGTPWDGKHRLSRNASAPLKAIIWLYRDTNTHIKPMTKTEAFPVLVNQAFGSSDPTLMARVMKLEERLLGAAAFYKMGCNTEKEAAVLAWEGMNKGISR